MCYAEYSQHTEGSFSTPSELEDALSRELHFEHSQQLRVIANFSGDLYTAQTRKKESAAVMPIFQWFLETIYWPTLF